MRLPILDLTRAWNYRECYPTSGEFDIGPWTHPRKGEWILGRMDEGDSRPMAMQCDDFNWNERTWTLIRTDK